MPTQHMFAPNGAVSSPLRLSSALAIALWVAVPAVHAADAPAMRVFKDPETGLLRAPTAQEAKALEDKEASENASKSRAAPSSSAKASAELQRATPAVTMRSSNGAVGARVGEQFMSYSVMKRNPDGTSSMVCVTGDEVAEALVKAPQSAAAPAAKGHRHAH